MFVDIDRGCGECVERVEVIHSTISLSPLSDGITVGKTWIFPSESFYSPRTGILLYNVMDGWLSISKFLKISVTFSTITVLIHNF